MQTKIYLKANKILDMRFEVIHNQTNRRWNSQVTKIIVIFFFAQDDVHVLFPNGWLIHKSPSVIHIMIICFWFSNESISKFFGGLKSLNDMVAKYRSYVYRNRKQFISNLWGLQPLIINYDNVCDYWHYSLVNILWSMAKKWIILWFRLNCECWIRYCVIGTRLEKQARTANLSSGKASKILGRAKIFPKNSKKIANISKYPKKRSGIAGSLKKMIPKNPEKIVKIPRNPEKSAKTTKNPKKKAKLL